MGMQLVVAAVEAPGAALRITKQSTVDSTTAEGE
jgi:hypothetical protein